MLGTVVNLPRRILFTYLGHRSELVHHLKICLEKLRLKQCANKTVAVKLKSKVVL